MNPPHLTGPMLRRQITRSAHLPFGFQKPGLQRLNVRHAPHPEKIPGRRSFSIGSRHLLTLTMATSISVEGVRFVFSADVAERSATPCRQRTSVSNEMKPLWFPSQIKPSE
jgi:hypothetical protein